MFNIGFPELAVILILGLILIGPEQLPSLARTVGKFLNEIKRGSDDFTRELRSADREFRSQLQQITQVDEETQKMHQMHPEPEQPTQLTEDSHNSPNTEVTEKTPEETDKDKV